MPELLSDDAGLVTVSARNKRARQKDLSRRQTVAPEKRKHSSTRKSVSFDLRGTNSSDSDIAQCSACAQLQRQNSSYLQQMEELQLLCEQQQAHIESLTEQLAEFQGPEAPAKRRRPGPPSEPPPPLPQLAAEVEAAEKTTMAAERNHSADRSSAILADTTNQSRPTVPGSLPFDALMLQQGMACLNRVGRPSHGSAKKIGRSRADRRKGALRDRKSVGTSLKMDDSLLLRSLATRRAQSRLVNESPHSICSVRQCISRQACSSTPIELVSV